MTKPKIAFIIGSTRKARYADKPAQWIMKQANARDDLAAELVDLRDFNLPLFDEVASSAHVPSQSPEARAWQQKLAGFDGFVFILGEYNRAMTASLKNALDHAGAEWQRKPFGTLGYGSVGAAYAVQNLRTASIELQMVPVRAAVYIAGSDFFKVHPFGANAPIEDIEAGLLPGTKAMFDDLVWWARATMAAKGKA